MTENLQLDPNIDVCAKHALNKKNIEFRILYFESWIFFEIFFKKLPKFWSFWVKFWAKKPWPKFGNKFQVTLK